MATINPFKGIRPPQELVEQVASRPTLYLIQKKHVQKLVKMRNHSII